MDAELVRLDLRAANTPLEFSPVGEWVGCAAKADDLLYCWFTDYRGAVWFQGVFAPLKGNQVSTLRILSGEGLYLQKQNTVVPIVRLYDGTILAPIQYLDDVRLVEKP